MLNEVAKKCVWLLLLTGLAYGQSNLATTAHCPCNLFAGEPVRKTSGPDKSVEVGTRFSSDVNTNIIAIRFYKMTGAPSSHTGTIWSPAGQKLATVNFAGETPSGWQVQNLPAPLAIQAGQIYTVSYHTDTGFEALDQNFTWPVNNGILHALGGVYNYSAGSNFPLKNNLTNYWADVVTGGYVQLTWLPSLHPNVLYNVYRSTTSTFDLTRPIASGLPVTNYLDTSVIGGQIYFWTVTATLQSLPSNTATASLP